MRAIIVGAVDSTRVAIRCLAASPRWQLAAVVTLPPEAAGRHSDFVDLTEDAAAAGAELIYAKEVNADEVIDRIAAIAPDYLFVIGWSQLCGERFLQSAPGGAVGYHPAPLPRLRGRGVIPWTILLQEPISAGTLFLIDEGTDSGGILAQQFFHVAADETAAGLYATHMGVLGEMLPDLLERLASGTAVPLVQNERHATWAARRRPDDAEIDWSRPADEIWRLVRACGHPYPGARTTCGGEMLTIDQAYPVPLEHHHASLVGQVVARDADGFTVRCGDRAGLLVTRWRRERNGPPPIHARLGRKGAGA